jgi:pimeloyl-ACP methyl ester carboxylesterase
VPTIAVNGTETFYEESGAGPPLVLLHGGFADHRMWEPQVAFFAPRYRVIRPDLRGHGRTRTLVDRPYSVDLLAADLAALLDALAVERAALCGVSFGGMVAQAFAVTQPDRLLALVLAGTAVSTALTWDDKVQRLLFPRWLMQGTLRLLGARRFVRLSFRVAAALRGSSWLGRDPATHGYLADAMLRMEEGAYADVFGALYDFGPVALEAIAAPTLIVNGEHESCSVFRHAAEFRRRIAGADAVVIPSAGHLANMERPDAFNAAVGGFLDRVVPRPGA